MSYRSVAKRRIAGFTLIEMLVTLALLGILGSMAGVVMLRAVPRRGPCAVFPTSSKSAAACSRSMRTVPSFRRMDRMQTLRMH